MDTIIIKIEREKDKEALQNFLVTKNLWQQQIATFDFGERVTNAWEYKGKSFHMRCDSRYVGFLLTTHFEQYEKYTEFKEIMLEYFNISDLKALEAVIVRQDCSLNLPLDYEFLISCLHQPRVKKYQWLVNHLGAKAPIWGSKKSGSETILYSKNIPYHKLDCILNGSVLDSLNRSVESTRFNEASERYSRLEVRLLKKRIPVRKLEDLEKIKNINVFGHLKTQYVSDAIIEELPFKVKQRLWAFLYRCRTVGRTQARKEFKSHYNLKSDIDKYFIDLENFDLFALWRDKIERFFN